MATTKIEAKLILASRNLKTGDTLYTFRLTYPRIILSEMGTHRVLSKNTSSSRAVPAKRYRTEVLRDPFIPMFVGKAQTGMQAGAELTGWRRSFIQKGYGLARYPAIAASWLLEKAGAPKQIVNRLLEPWLWVSQIVTATDWQNFISQRCHPDAEPHIRELALSIKRAVCFSDFSFIGAGSDTYLLGLTEPQKAVYKLLYPGEWHIPHITQDEQNSFETEELLALSTARSARESYTSISSEAKQNVLTDKALHDKLLNSKPPHLSPFEHAAQAQDESEYWGNFRGFKQYRKQIENESGGDPQR